MARPVDLRCELAACIAVAGSVAAAVGRWRPWLEGQRYPRKRRSYQARGRTPGDPPQVAAAAAAVKIKYITTFALFFAKHLAIYYH